MSTEKVYSPNYSQKKPKYSVIEKTVAAFSLLVAGIVSTVALSAVNKQNDFAQVAETVTTPIENGAKLPVALNNEIYWCTVAQHVNPETGNLDTTCTTGKIPLKDGSTIKLIFETNDSTTVKPDIGKDVVKMIVPFRYLRTVKITSDTPSPN